MKVLVSAVLLVAACSDPPFKIVYRLADGGGGQTCGTSSCLDIQMACESVLHVRVLSPSNPRTPYVSICREVPKNNAPPLLGSDLCAIANIDLEGPTSLPRETLEVQVTVWPKVAVVDENNNLDCARTQVEFDATYGFPTSPEPAFGGRAFYTPGDSEVVVTLGCTNVPAVNSPVCTGENNVSISATVLDFENLPNPVLPAAADNLSVRVGEPNATSQLPGTSTFPLRLASSGQTPVWTTSIENTFNSSACVQVDEPDVPQSTASIRCESINGGLRMFETSGVRVPKATIDGILDALDLATFPANGITIGMVVDDNGNPVAGVDIDVDEGTIEYLNPNRTGISPTTVTTTSGVFVSRDAPYGALFTQPANPLVPAAIGGLVLGKITVVLFEPTQTGG